MANYKKGDVVEYRVKGHLRHVCVMQVHNRGGRPGFRGEIVWDAIEASQVGRTGQGNDARITRVNPSDRPVTTTDLLRSPFTLRGPYMH